MLVPRERHTKLLLDYKWVIMQEDKREAVRLESQYSKRQNHICRSVSGLGMTVCCLFVFLSLRGRGVKLFVRKPNHMSVTVFGLL